MIKVIFEGLPDQGKSYVTAVETVRLLRRNKHWFEKGITKKLRLVFTEMKLSDFIEKKYKNYLRYYRGLKDLPDLRQCDVIIDDMGTRLSAARWQETPEACKNWFRLMGHYECDVYGNAQDFLDIEISVRRKTRHVVSLTKLCGSQRPGETFPPVKRIWGIIIQRHVHYSELDKEQWKRKESKLGWPIFITRSNCEIYDTLQLLEKTEMPPYECRERICDNPDHIDVHGKRFSRFIHI